MSCKTLVASLLLGLATVSHGLAEKPKKVLLLGQRRDHPPKSHEYMAGLHVLAKSLEGVPGLELTIHQADEPWTEGPELLKEADGIVMFLGEGSRWEQINPKRYQALKLPHLAGRRDAQRVGKNFRRSLHRRPSRDTLIAMRER